MNIGIFIYDFLPKIGGTEVSAHCTANCFVRAGHNVTVYTSNKLVDECHRSGWRFEYGLRGIPRFIPYVLRKHLEIGKRLLAQKMIHAVRRDRLDVVQIMLSWPWIAAAEDLKRATGVPIVIRCAGEDIQVNHTVGYGIQRNDRIRRAQQRGFQYIDIGVAISQTVREEYLAAGILGEKIRMIPPGVDLQAFRGYSVPRVEVRRKWNLPECKKLIIGVGRNHRKKCFKDLVSALPVLNKEGNRFAVAVIGKDSEQLVAQACSLGVKDSYFPIAEVAGAQAGSLGSFPSADLIDLYKAADYFVHPSAVETYANVALEAMAAGTPVIVTVAPGNVDTVSDGVDGLYVPLNSPEQIAERILLLEGDDALRKRLVNAGAARAGRQDWMQVSETYLGIYRFLLAKRRETSSVR